jgi:hypothetical protein
MCQKKIIKLLIIGWISFAGSYNSFAQNFGGGLKSGMVASEVSGDNLAGPSKLGWYASAFTFARLNEFNDILLEIMYIEKGSRSIPSEKNNFLEYRFSLRYVEIPVLYRMEISRYTDISFVERFTVYAGISASVLVGDEETDMGTPVPESARKAFNPAELNALAGISFPVFGGFDLQIGLTRSVTPVRAHSGGGTTWYNHGQYNTAWQFGLSYVIW